MARRCRWIQAVVCLAALIAAGCNNSSDTNTQKPDEAIDPHAGHDHGSLGPHGGHLLELGEEDYHAEWRFNDDSGKVTIYLLDAEAKKAVTTTAKEISVKVTHGENVSDYQLPAINQSDDDPPTASEFELVDTVMLELLKGVGHGIDASLTVTIDDKQYSGAFGHLPH